MKTEIMSKKQGLTIEKLRTYKGLEEVTEDEAYKIIETLTRLSQLTFRVYFEYKEKGTLGEIIDSLTHSEKEDSY